MSETCPMAAFVEALAARGVEASAADPDLRAALGDALDRARSSAPDWQVPEDRFAAHLGVHVGVDEGVQIGLQRIHVEDLYLACGCMHGIAAALGTFEARHRRDMRGRVRADGSALDELEQDVRDRLFVGSEDRAARIGDYAGRGSLSAWVTIVARRRWLDRQRTPEPAAAGTSIAPGLVADYGDPEQAIARAGPREELIGALERAAASLTRQERNLLRYQIIHRLKVEEIAGIYRVSASTAARRLAAARSRLVERLREDLRERLGLAGQQLDSELRSLRSGLDVTLSRVLRHPD